MSMRFDTEMLICEVEMKPQIWDPSHEGYKNREIRLNAWQEISKNLGFGGLNEEAQKKCVDKVQKRWKAARDAYFRSLNKIHKAKSGSIYIYHDQLSFLDRIREAPTESNFDSETISQDIDYNNDPLTQDEPSEEQIDDVQPNIDYNNDPLAQDESCEEQIGDVRPNISTVKQSFKRKRPARNSSFEDNLLNLLIDIMDKEDDDDRAFLTSLLPTLKTLKAHQKLLFRSKVLQLLMEMTPS